MKLLGHYEVFNKKKNRSLPSCNKMTSSGTRNICTNLYLHKCSRDWSVFLWPDGVTLDGMPHGRKYTIGFVHVITGSILPTWRSVAVQHKYLWCLPQNAAYCYRLLTALRSRKNTFAIVGFVKVRNKALSKIREMFVRNIFLIEQQIKYRNCSVHLFCRYVTAIAS
jgi:hypothetical protein